MMDKYQSPSECLMWLPANLYPYLTTQTHFRSLPVWISK
jgi:hypothetical protein